ncbi:MAG: phosphoribosylamine--glycine ligase [Bacteroidia bacterium]|nr:phosphoribosylamine--glycine ligase [Bacteroidia bacterium]
MNILLIGSGGREHALAWKLKQSSKLNTLFIAPGNAGTASCGTNLYFDVSDFGKVKSCILDKNINMLVVGPEAPLVEGIRDFIEGDAELKNVMVIGPGKAGAQLEGSKDFSKAFMQKHNIPTAAYQSFTKNNLEQGYAFLETLSAPYVLKADGLAAGKGVLILEDLQEAKDALKEMLVNEQFGAASNTVVIEEFLKGEEVSVFVLTDGENYVVLPEAHDYKRIGENDTGPNTGGMGAISPVPFANDLFMQKVTDQIIEPTISGLQKDGIPYCGFIFIGLMNVDGNPFVIEYNVRMGDPETEVVIPRLKTDLIDLFEAAHNKTLNKISIEFDTRTCAAVMLVSGGYPASYEKGFEISGIENTSDCNLFYAGAKNENGKVITNGGRVLAVSAMANELEDALQKAYNNAEKISFEKMNYRIDIGKDLLQHRTAKLSG